jgi:hypothetical protein
VLTARATLAQTEEGATFQQRQQQLLQQVQFVADSCAAMERVLADCSVQVSAHNAALFTVEIILMHAGA